MGTGGSDRCGTLCGLNHGREQLDQMPSVDRFVCDIPGRLIEVGSLRLRHHAFALGKALFLELFDRALHLAQLPGSQADVASLPQRRQRKWVVAMGRPCRAVFISRSSRRVAKQRGQ